MVCGIELVEAEASEPQVGTCQLLAPIGQPCIPTFSRLGRCEEGGTCNSRPSGECIPLREIGESCGYSQCVDGAYCQAYSIIDDEPSHTCYASRVEGRRCYDIDYICEEGLLCLCPAEDCDLALESTCARPAQLGGACDERMRCAAGLNCANAVCESPPEPPQPVLPAAFGEQCERTVRFGRIDGNCETDVEGAECLCADAQCAQAYCALPSLGAESCNGQTEICRAGFVCENEICVELASQQIEMQSCNP
jgi:hypothetical protein